MLKYLCQGHPLDKICLSQVLSFLIVQYLHSLHRFLNLKALLLSTCRALEELPPSVLKSVTPSHLLRPTTPGVVWPVKMHNGFFLF